MTTFYTDYPIQELGDILGKAGPVRECSLLSYDGDKYVDILVEGVEKSIKRFYVFTREGETGGYKSLYTTPVTDVELETVKK